MGSARSSSLASHRAFRAAVAASFGCAMAAVVYAWVRAVEVALFPQVDPRTTFGVVQSGYLLRCAVAAFGAGMGVFAGVALGSEPRRAARALVLAVAIAAAAIALQAAFSP